MKAMIALLAFLGLALGPANAPAAETAGKVKLCFSGGNKRTAVFSLLVHKSTLEGATGSITVPLSGPFHSEGNGCLISLARSASSQRPAQGATWSVNISYLEVIIDMDHGGKSTSSKVHATLTAVALEKFTPVQPGRPGERVPGSE